MHGGGPVSGATVVLVGAEDAGSPATSLSPLEDLAAGSPFRGTTDRNGNFRIEADPGRWFILVLPREDDSTHLPGGTFARRSLELESGSLSVLSIELSEEPPADATFVGSSTCLDCHPSHATVRDTLHTIALRRLGPDGAILSPLQDLAHWPEANAALAYFTDGNPNDNTGAGDGYGLRVDTGLGWSVLLGKDATGHFQALESADQGAVSERLYVVFTYGGEGRWAMDFLTRLDPSGSFTGDPTLGSYHVLPAQFVETRGESVWGASSTVPHWEAIFPERWTPPVADGGPPLATPSPEQSFDNDCSGCHLPGMDLVALAGGGVRAVATNDPGGAFDFDGDGSLDEINVGCEACHGPGSEHAANARGSIVEPNLLAPGRANLVCGRCHMRGTGNGSVAGVAPGSFPSRDAASGDALVLPRPGISPAEFLATPAGGKPLPSFGTTGGFFDTIDLGANEEASWRDRSGGFGSRYDHARLGMQTWMDHVRSRHAQNPFELIVCHDCHDPHAAENEAQLVLPAVNDLLCLDCHAGFGDFAAVSGDDLDELEAENSARGPIAEAIDAHIRERTFELVGVAMNLGAGIYANPSGGHELGRCTTCHMPRTARAGGFIRDTAGFLIRGDLPAHTFDVISPDTREAMAASGLEPLPGSCVPCHQGPPNGAWPDWRFSPAEE